MKVDLVMWTKNGSETLPFVLKRIDEVIPSELVNKRIIIDDRSTDDTREIAKSFGWNVVFNEGKGISDGANTALKNVEANYFISFEQDLVLSRDWWEKIPLLLEKRKIAVASGIRLTEGLKTFYKIEQFAYERYEKGQKSGKFDIDKFLYGKTSDNTIYKTEIIRKIGGFPKLSVPGGVDTLLALRLHLAGYEWIVNYNVKSEHLRKGIKDELTHHYRYGTCFDGVSKALGVSCPSIKRMVLRLLFSPFRGLQIALKKGDVRTVYVYPLIRYNILKGIVDNRREH